MKYLGKAVAEMFAVLDRVIGLTRREFRKYYFGAFSYFRNYPDIIFLLERFTATVGRCYCLDF